MDRILYMQFEHKLHIQKQFNELKIHFYFNKFAGDGKPKLQLCISFKSILRFTTFPTFAYLLDFVPKI